MEQVHREWVREPGAEPEDASTTTHREVGWDEEIARGGVAAVTAAAEVKDEVAEVGAEAIAEPIADRLPPRR
jgi:hypothetical protein